MSGPGEMQAKRTRANAEARHSTRIFPGYDKRLPAAAQAVVEQALLDNDLANADADDARWRQLYDELDTLIHRSREMPAPEAPKTHTGSFLDNDDEGQYEWGSDSDDDCEAQAVSSHYDLQTFTLIKDVFLPINPRFSSIMVQDKDGEKRWKQVEVNLKDHVHFPKFPKGKTVESYDKFFHDYLSSIAMEQLPQSRPLWEIHVISYPSKDASGSIIFKLHHALGDGYSLVGALLSCLQRADDPSLPLSFPTLRSLKPQSSTKSFWRRFSWMFSSAINTATDFGWSVLKSSIISDDKTPIRSGDEGTEFRPISISTMNFSIDHIKIIKSRLGVTINDVITGIVFYGTRLYMQDVDLKSKTADSTALVLLNTRNIEGYQTINDMLNSKAKGPWGNKISFLHVPIPKLNQNRMSNPLDFIWDSHNIIKRKKQSLAVALTGTLLDMESKFRGQEAVAKHLRGTVTNSSAVISSLVGPIQQMSLANHPVKGLYFTLAGGPESLAISIMSYVGVLRITLKTEKDFIDEEKLKSCIQNAFHTILKAATENS